MRKGGTPHYPIPHFCRCSSPVVEYVLRIKWGFNKYDIIRFNTAFDPVLNI